MVKIRLRRTGKRNAPCYRVVVADVRSPRDGKFIETIGLYDPRQSIEKVDLERVDYWLSVGAQPTGTAADIIRRAKTGATTSNNKAKIREQKAAEAAKAAAAEAAEANTEESAEEAAAES